MFWTSQQIEARNGLSKLIEPFDANAIKQGSYELSMGSQAAISRDGENSAVILGSREIFSIPPGQFGLLLTEEIVHLPANLIAFISLKTKIKSEGLVNVSGFHVDPGFCGRLKFWVYNAGNKTVRLQRGSRTFLIWFSDFNEDVRDPYPNHDPRSQNEITAADLGQLEGHLASPAALAERLDTLAKNLERNTYITNTVLVIVVGLVLALAAPLLENLLNATIFSKTASKSTGIEIKSALKTSTAP